MPKAANIVLRSSSEVVWEAMLSTAALQLLLIFMAEIQFQWTVDPGLTLATAHCSASCGHCQLLLQLLLKKKKKLP